MSFDVSSTNLEQYLSLIVLTTTRLFREESQYATTVFNRLTIKLAIAGW